MMGPRQMRSTYNEALWVQSMGSRGSVGLWDGEGLWGGGVNSRGGGDLGVESKGWGS